jgi:hypothetical protein
MSLKDSKKGSYRLANFTYGGKDYGAVYGHILRKKAKITAGFTKDGRPLIKYGIDMRLDVKTQSAFMEYYGEKDNYKLRNAVAAALSNQIKRNIASANDTAKTLNADFFNHRYRFYRTCPKKIKAFEKNSEGSFLDNLVIESAVNIDAD